MGGQRGGAAGGRALGVDGTLIEAAASLKSFWPKKGPPPPMDDDPGNPSVDFRRGRRSNETHASTMAPRRVCYARAWARKPGWHSWAMP